MTYVVVALYHFFDFPDFADRRVPIRNAFLRLGVKGTLLLTPEGINGTLAGSAAAMEGMIAYLQNEVTGAPFDYKTSYCEQEPFKRTKVKLKKETISIGEPAPLDKRGEYLDAKEWNTLIADPETILIDTRNRYEVEIGTFEGAINPDIRTFKELPAFIRKHHGDDKHRKIATFCTGGIRCEKFTAWMRDQGYEHVYHLKGGILKYIEDTPAEQSKWQGDCFVFDERVAVKTHRDVRAHEN